MEGQKPESPLFVTASIHIHKYSRLKKIAILHSQFQIEIGCSEIDNKTS